MNKQFKEWLINHQDLDYMGLWENLNNLPFSMQWGVYLEFFDSFDIRIETSTNVTGNFYWGVWTGKLCDWNFDNKETRQEAQKEAIKKAFEILENAVT